MAHFAVTSPPLPGHINPLAELARTLVARGHRVTFVNLEDARRHVPAEFGFEAIGADEYPAGGLQPYLARLARLGGPISVWRMVRDVARISDVIAGRLPAAIARIGADAVIADQAEPAGGLVAEGLRLPFVTVANALPLNREPSVPPPYLPWPYDPRPRGLRRNRGGYRVADWISRPISDVIERHAAAFGLPRKRLIEDCWSPALQITQCVRGLDYPRRELPDSVHYLGPFRGPDAPLDFELPDDGRPLVFCSFGTLQGSRAGLFRSVATAAAELDVTLLLAHGGLLDEAAARRLPGNPIVRAYVPQRAVLARAAAAVTHAGFNTVMDALSFGVPMVALPIAFEQPATGARLKRAGAGVALQRRRTAGRIREALRAVLTDSAYRIGAGRLAAEIAAAGGVKRAADLVEQILPGTGRGTS